MHRSLQNLSVFNLSPRNAASGHIQLISLKEIGFLRSCRNRTGALACAHSLCCVSAGLPRQGKKMLLYSLMRKKPDNFLSRHCYYSMFRRRGCKENPPFRKIFPFCCSQQNGVPFRKSFYHFTVYPPLNAKLSFTACTCALLYPLSYIQFTKAHFFSLDFMPESFSSCSLFFTLK